MQTMLFGFVALWSYLKLFTLLPVHNRKNVKTLFLISLYEFISLLMLLYLRTVPQCRTGVSIIEDVLSCFAVFVSSFCFQCLGWAVFCDCCLSWVSSNIFVVRQSTQLNWLTLKLSTRSTDRFLKSCMGIMNVF